MKKFLSIILCVIISTLSFCSCSTNGLTVTFEDGSTSKMSAEEIMELKQTNERKFDTISSISGSGTITDIIGSHVTLAGDCIDLTLDDNLVITIHKTNSFSPEEWNTYWQSFYRGDKITFKEGDNHHIVYEKLNIWVMHSNVSIV